MTLILTKMILTLDLRVEVPRRSPLLLPLPLPYPPSRLTDHSLLAHPHPSWLPLLLSAPPSVFRR